jgi:hypothetical protein
MKRKLTPTQRVAVDAVIPTSFWETYKPKPSHRGCQYRLFVEAREFARSLRLSGVKEWVVWSKSTHRPPDIPASPPMVYEGWINWGDWLGTGRVSPRRSFRSFAEAREFVRTLGLKCYRDWEIWRKSERPLDIPTDPSRVYKEEWVSWSDWLGIEWRPFAKAGEWRPFNEARVFARSLGFSNRREWNVWRKSSARPLDIPTDPGRVYAEWVSWSDWLGTGWRPFAEAREFARSLKLKSRKEWNVWSSNSNRPLDIPGCPRTAYPEFLGFGDWLGTGTVAPQKRQFLSFTEAREFVRSLKFSNHGEWKVWAKSGRPLDIPSSPRRTYKAEWVSWGDWLGTGNVWEIKLRKNR